MGTCPQKAEQWGSQPHQGNEKSIQEVMDRLRRQLDGDTLILCERAEEGDNLWYFARVSNRWEIVEEEELVPTLRTRRGTERWLRRRKGVFEWMQSRASGGVVRVLVWERSAAEQADEEPNGPELDAEIPPRAHNDPGPVLKDTRGRYYINSRGNRTYIAN